MAKKKKIFESILISFRNLSQSGSKFLFLFYFFFEIQIYISEIQLWAKSIYINSVGLFFFIFEHQFFFHLHWL